MMAPTRPVLRYHGGKWLLAPWIISHFPAHRIYVEPFAGGGSVLMRKPRSFAEIYNDLDQDVVNLFRILRDPEQADKLRAQLELTPWSRVEFLASYERAEDPVEQARRTITRCFMAHGATSRRRNRTGFRAKAYRRNQTGVADWVSYPKQLERFVARLRWVTVECRPAVEIIAQQDTPETLFYVDPPYVQSTRTSIRTPSETDRAYAHDLTDGDHRQLAAVLRSVAGMIVLSGYRSPLYDELYGDWQRVEIETFADGAMPRTECLWLSPATVRHRMAPSLFDGGAAA